MCSSVQDAVALKKQLCRDNVAHTQPPAKRRVLTPARREQNKLAQKAYRERQKVERLRIKDEKSRARQNKRPRPLLKRHDIGSNKQPDHRGSNNDLSSSSPSLSKEQSHDGTQLVKSPASSSPNDTDLDISSTFPDVYLNMLQFFPTAFFGSCLANAMALGFDLSVVANCNAENLSPFYRPEISATFDSTALTQKCSTFLSSFTNTSVPVHLRPTMAQILIPHHISLDLIPLPYFRERSIMLSAAFPQTMNCWELKLDIYARDGLTTWRLGSGREEKTNDSYPPWEPKSWEAAPWFLNKWCMVMGKEYEKLQQQSIGWQVVRDMICSHEKLQQSA